MPATRRGPLGALLVGAAACLLAAACAEVPAGGADSGAGSASSGPSRTTSVSGGRPGSGQAHLVLEAGVTDITVHGASIDQLYQATFVYPSGVYTVNQLDQGSSTVTLRLKDQEPHIGSHPGHRALDVTLSNAVGWTLQILSGAASVNLDLTALHLQSVDVNSGASQVDVKLPQPRGTVAVTLDGGATTLVAHVPASVPAQVRLSAAAAHVTVDSSKQVDEGNYTDAGYGGAANRYTIVANGGADSVQLLHGSS